MNNTNVVVNFEIPDEYYGAVDFPVRLNGRRIGRQIEKAAKKNKFPVGLRREIYMARSCEKHWEYRRKNVAKAASDRKITEMILEEMLEAAE